MDKIFYRWLVEKMPNDMATIIKVNFSTDEYATKRLSIYFDVYRLTSKNERPPRSILGLTRCYKRFITIMLRLLLP